MNWTVYILASAVFLAFYDLAKKASVRDNAVLPVLFWATVFGCAGFIAVAALTGRLMTGIAAIDSTLICLAAIKSVIVATSWIFTFCALRTLPISIATPIRASAPALVFLAAFFLYAERPSVVQGLGMLTVFGGYFVFSWAGKHEGIDFLRNRAVWCAFAGMVCSAASALWDKYIFNVRGANIEAVQLLFQIGLVVFYGISELSVRLIFRLKGTVPVKFNWRATIPCVGVLLAAADWLYFTGISKPDVAISVASLMRRFSVVITFVIGAKLFKETNLVRKAIALLAILVGVVLLVLN